jgi:hypothetical protein
MQIGDQSRRRIRSALLVSLTTVSVLVILAVIDRLRNEDEEYAVYSAYLSQGLLNDAHDWSVDTPIQVVVADKSEVNTIFRLWALHLANNQSGFSSLHVSTRSSFVIRNLYHTQIRPEFSLPKRATVALAPEAEIAQSSHLSSFYEKFPHSLGYITLSGVGFNPSRTQAIFYIEHMCGLCGGGRYVLMEKVAGTWVVRDEHYTWIS